MTCAERYERGGTPNFTSLLGMGHPMSIYFSCMESEKISWGGPMLHDATKNGNQPFIYEIQAIGTGSSSFRKDHPIHWSKENPACQKNRIAFSI